MLPLFPVFTDKMNMTPTNETSHVSDELSSSTITYDPANLMELTGWNSSTNQPSNTSDSEQGGTKVHYFGIIFMIVSLVLTVVLNTLVLVTIWRRKNLHTPTYIFIANIAVGDLIFALSTYTVNLQPSITGSWKLGEVFCQIHAYSIHVLAFQTLLSLMYISVDRFISMSRPLQARNIMTRKRCYVMVAHTWIHPLLTYMPPLLGWGKYQYFHNIYSCSLVWSQKYIIFIRFLGGTFFLAVLVICFCYVRIFMVVRGMSQSIQPVNNSSIANYLMREIHNSLWIFITIVEFLVFYNIYVAVRICQMYIPSEILTQLEYYTHYIFSCQTWLNACIYGLFNKKFRRELTYAISGER